MRMQLVNRGFGDRLLDLRSSLLLIRDALGELRSGKPHFILPLFAMLRALLIEKRRDNEPLLLHLSARLGTEPCIFWMPGSPDDVSQATGIPAPDVYYGGFPMGLQKELPSQQAISIQALLKEKIVFLHGSQFSLADLIKICAEKAGGAHWARRLTQGQQDLLAFNLVGLQPAHQALAQFAGVVLQFGQVLLSKLTTQHIHLFAVIPEQEIQNPTALFSFGYANGENTIRLIIGRRRGFVVHLRAFNGDQIKLQCSPDFTAHELHHLEVAHELDGNLRSVLSMRLDGKLCGESVASLPILYDGRGHRLEGRLNVSVAEGVRDGIEFALADVLVRGEATESYARRKLESCFRAKNFVPEQRLLVIKPECHGSTSPRNRRFQFEEPAKLGKLQSYIDDHSGRAKNSVPPDGIP